jgi:hypothetical protein
MVTSTEEVRDSFGKPEVRHETRVVGKKHTECVIRRSLIIPRLTGIAYFPHLPQLNDAEIITVFSFTMLQLILYLFFTHNTTTVRAKRIVMEVIYLGSADSLDRHAELYFLLAGLTFRL